MSHVVYGDVWGFAPVAEYLPVLRRHPRVKEITISSLGTKEVKRNFDLES